MITQVGPEYMDLVWPQFLPYVERGLRHGQGDSVEPRHILGGLKEGRFALWIAHEGEDIKAGLVFEVNEFPIKKVMFIVMLVGDRWDEWADEMEDTLLQYKEVNDIDCIEASCRAGLVKKLMKRGWKRKATIMELR